MCDTAARHPWTSVLSTKVTAKGKSDLCHFNKYLLNQDEDGYFQGFT